MVSYLDFKNKKFKKKIQYETHYFKPNKHKEIKPNPN